MSMQLPDLPRDVPRIIFAQRVIDKMVRGAQLYPGTETGESLVGLIVLQEGRLEPDIFVLDTISPGEDSIREWGMFEHGDDWQADVGNWLAKNWEAFRELRRPSYGNALAAKWDAPLMHVGDWHKQPGSMIAPSLGDLETARAVIESADTPMQHIVAPIITMYRVSSAKGAAMAAEVDATPVGESAAFTLERDTVSDDPASAAPAAEDDMASQPEAPAMPVQQPAAASNTLVRKVEEAGLIVRIDCWYISHRRRRFVPVTPVVWPDEQLPKLPPLIWHLAYPRRFEQEMKLLEDDGYMVSQYRFDADGKPPYESCFSIYKQGHDKALVLITSVDYPNEMPAVRVASLSSIQLDDNEDFFEKLYEASEPVLMTDLPTWPWDSKRTLLELVWHIEKRLMKGGKSG